MTLQGRIWENTSFNPTLLPPSELLIVLSLSKPNQRPASKRALCCSLCRSTSQSREQGEGWWVGPKGPMGESSVYPLTQARLNQRLRGDSPRTDDPLQQVCILLTFVTLLSNNCLALSKHSTNTCFGKSSIVSLHFSIFKKNVFNLLLNWSKTCLCGVIEKYENTQSGKSLACELKTVLSPMSCARQFCTWMNSTANLGSLTAS